MASERIDEVFDPEKAIKRAINYYRKRGYSDKWIESRLKGILDRNKLTDVWRENEIKEEYEYGILTNEIYRAWSGMKASEYKKFKGIRKESLRDNMTDIEVLLTDIGEITTCELARKHKPYGLEQNKKVARVGGSVAKNTRKAIEKKLGENVLQGNHFLNDQYMNDKRIKNAKN